MAAILKHTITKTDSQDWSSLYINVEKSLSSTPDPRDNCAGDINLHKTQLKAFSPRTISANGYIGWDREYQSNNVLVITYKFDTPENARAYLQKRRDKRANTASSVPFEYSATFEITQSE